MIYVNCDKSDSTECTYVLQSNCLRTEDVESCQEGFVFFYVSPVIPQFLFCFSFYI